VQIGPDQTELEYFARYANEVQPALDAHDPDEEGPVPTETTLNGNALNLEPNDSELNTNGDTASPPQGYYEQHHTNVDAIKNGSSLNHPRPTSPASSGSVENLERQAESSSQAELAIKQHISTDMKSLFRLAKAAGIAREEFERIVKRELEVLPMLEQDE
jgi:hypothetical protein